MDQKVYHIVCEFKAVGIKEIPADSFDEAVKLARKDTYPFKQIGRIKKCTVDEEHSRMITEKGLSEEEKKEYLNWGAE